jgi:hypothetical protein
MKIPFALSAWIAANAGKHRHGVDGREECTIRGELTVLDAVVDELTTEVTLSKNESSSSVL